MDARYNLRSSKRECHIPVQLQLVNDKFLTESLASASGAGQVFDSELCNSGHDIFALLDHLDKKLS